MLAGVVLVAGGRRRAADRAGAVVRACWRCSPCAFGPYAIFHLLFQETLTVRYALPLVPPVALPCRVVTRRGGDARRVGDRDRRAGRCRPVARRCRPERRSRAHRARSSRCSRRCACCRLAARSRSSACIGACSPSRAAPASMRGELPGTAAACAARLRVAGADAHVARRPRRRDVVPRRSAANRSGADRLGAHARTREYRWPFNGRVYVGGARPDEIDWHIISEPGWFLERGWALTPETAGITERDGWGPHRQPSIGWVRRRDRRRADDDWRPPPRRRRRSARRRQRSTIARSTSFESGPGSSCEFVDVPAGALAGDGRYAQLTVSAQAPGDGAERRRVAIEQFNLQAADARAVRLRRGLVRAGVQPADGAVVALDERARGRAGAPRRHATSRSGSAANRRCGTSTRRRAFASAAGDHVLAEIAPDGRFHRWRSRSRRRSAAAKAAPRQSSTSSSAIALGVAAATLR